MEPCTPVLVGGGQLNQRDGDSEPVAVRTPDGGRTLAATRTPDELRALVEDDPAGAAVHVQEDGTARLDGAMRASRTENKPIAVR